MTYVNELIRLPAENKDDIKKLENINHKLLNEKWFNIFNEIGLNNYNIKKEWGRFNQKDLNRKKDKLNPKWVSLDRLIYFWIKFNPSLFPIWFGAIWTAFWV